MGNKRGVFESGLKIKLGFYPKSKRSQVTIFIIIAIFIVSAAALIFIFKDSLFGRNIPSSIEFIYTDFLSCVEEEARVGIDLLETQGGYIELPNFEPGSEYMPFSSQLNFLGNPIPYWYYVSGNNIQKQQVPSRVSMGESLSSFIGTKVSECDFSAYYDRGFLVDRGDSIVDVLIKEDKVEVSMKMDLNFVKGEDSFLIKDHKVIIDSSLGKLYDSALRVYQKEQETLFLEEYAVDTLRLYAPVDGVELSCSPKIWSAESVFDELQDAIELNTQALKAKKGSYSLKSRENEYFVVDLGIDEDVRFLNSKTWANAFEVSPTEGNVLIAKPVGNQPGLGILGFCYVPYHFVYSIKYPVLIQVYSDVTSEIFQFPVAVVLQGNNPRNSLDASASEIRAPELCEYKNNLVDVRVYDTTLNPVEADISYECFGSKCSIGKTQKGELSDNFPQCVNGYILARAEGYEDSKYQFSTTKEDSVDIIMDRVYELGIDLKLDSKNYENDAIITFIGDRSSKTVVYPEQKVIKLSEGQYEVQVYIHRNSSLRLEATTQEQCVEVTKSGLGGFFGITEKQCFDIEIPSQIISNALAGGGKENYYILEFELKDSRVVEINAQSLPRPDSLDQLQDNYALFETKGLDILFK